MSNTVQLTLNDTPLAVEEGQTILDLCRAQQVFLPALCNFKGLSAVGACRLCVVEVRGIPRLLPACATKVAEGMYIVTNSPKLLEYRKMILELLFAERNHVCSICVANGNCELQSLAQLCGVTHTRYDYRYPTHHVDASHARFGFDPNRCILCTRCVRVCTEVEGARTWSVIGRGIQSDVTTDLHAPWGESQTCTSCSKCVHVCPTGALFEKGRATGEMRKRENILPYLSTMRTI
jgi:bidirectional [NiFe] hydrogenase diaphorase subunit